MNKCLCPIESCDEMVPDNTFVCPRCQSECAGADEVEIAMQIAMRGESQPTPVPPGVDEPARAPKPVTLDDYVAAAREEDKKPIPQANTEEEWVQAQADALARQHDPQERLRQHAQNSMAAVTAALMGDAQLVMGLTSGRDWTAADNLMLAMWAAQGIAHMAEAQGRDPLEVIREMGLKIASGEME